MSSAKKKKASYDGLKKLKKQGNSFQKHGLQIKKGSTFEKIIHLNRNIEKKEKNGQKIALVLIIMTTAICSLLYIYTTYFSDSYSHTSLQNMMTELKAFIVKDSNE